MMNYSPHVLPRAEARRRGVVVCSICFCFLLIFVFSCDLFNAPVDPDFWKKIDEEIAWANAERLTVTVALPSGWGSSPQEGTGRVFDNKRTMETPRLGYDFNVDFSPDQAYVFKGWRAYETSMLSSLEDDNGNEINWRQFPDILNDVPQLTDVEIPLVPRMGGTGTFVINNTTPVTLIPFCQYEPYVTRIEPRGEDRNDPVTVRSYHPSTDIVIYFSVPLSHSMDWNSWDGIVNIRSRPIDKIAASGVFTNINSRFREELVYESRAGLHTLTISPRAGTAGPETDHQIEVTIGTNIFNTGDGKMSEPEVFYYRVGAQEDSEELEAYISSWQASYDGGSIIDFSWEVSGEDSEDESVYSNVYYYKNRVLGDLDINENAGTISGVTPPDADNVRQGIGTNKNSIDEYRIVIELYAGGYPVDSKEFKIWNIPGMIVGWIDEETETNDETTVIEKKQITTTEINSTEDFEAIDWSKPYTQYVLVNDIELSSHTPIANFTGNFYGNGHAVTIKSFNPAYTGTAYGFFAVVGTGVVIRDVTIVYDNGTGEAVTVNPTTAAHFGGIAGTATENAKILNVLVKGAATFNVSGDTTAFVGGIVGLMGNPNSGGTRSNASIENAYGGLNITVRKTSTGTNGSLYVGGIAGSMGRPGLTRGELNTGDMVKVINVSATGNITVGGIGAAVNTANTTTDPISLFVGGLMGVMRGASSASRAELRYSDYRNGFINIFSGSGTVRLGGAVGQIFNFSEISNCFANQGGFTVEKTGTGNRFTAGGFLGYQEEQNTIIEHCYATGPVSISSTSFAGSIYAGGFAGFVTNLSNCFAAGSVTVSQQSGTTLVGGLIGGGGNSSTVINSAALGASVAVTGTSTKDIGRITGRGINNTILSNNRAWDGMGVYESLVYGNNNPAISSSVTDLTKTHNNKDGQSISGDSFRRLDIWAFPAPPSGTPPGVLNGMGFSAVHWDFSSVPVRGYPLLRASPNGPIMGGQ